MHLIVREHHGRRGRETGRAWEIGSQVCLLETEGKLHSYDLNHILPNQDSTMATPTDTLTLKNDISWSPTLKQRPVTAKNGWKSPSGGMSPTTAYSIAGGQLWNHNNINTSNTKQTHQVVVMDLPSTHTLTNNNQKKRLWTCEGVERYGWDWREEEREWELLCNYILIKSKKKINAN